MVKQGILKIEKVRSVAVTFQRDQFMEMNRDTEFAEWKLAGQAKKGEKMGSLQRIRA